MHFLIQLLFTQPDLLTEHARAYVDLVSSEIAEASAAQTHKTLWSAALLCCLGVTAVLAGLALMLHAVLPQSSLYATCILFATPVLPLIAAMACFWILRAKGNGPAFAKVKEQIQADMHMLREMRTP